MLRFAEVQFPSFPMLYRRDQHVPHKRRKLIHEREGEVISINDMLANLMGAGDDGADKAGPPLRACLVAPDVKWDALVPHWDADDCALFARGSSFPNLISAARSSRWQVNSREAYADGTHGYLPERKPIWRLDGTCGRCNPLNRSMVRAGVAAQHARKRRR